MESFEITNNKKFMSELLTGERFDTFLLYSAVIKKDINYLFEGMLNSDFYGEDEEPEYSFTEWKNIKQHMFDIFKGKKLPLEFKFILYLKPEIMKEILQKEEISAPEVKDFILNIYYKDGKVTATTGVAFNAFTLDRTPEKLWDYFAGKLLADY